ncbi:hypothetical protein ASF87_08420 [Microbacterium sp. Leaf161]|uniref:hypothetical protein n=1 Tax=Microbacterium sp. Leaf161 TaxID=1736281 RepID=UPI0006F4B043|nr:hypothetical protein [Microbacterium sp. Leaf161]KQR48845.1 hypothetical protein ASF87_08420 [Microbacterium sp. Leaf161]
MGHRRRRTDAAPLFAAAAVAYTANVALGSAVAAKVVDTSNFRWLHHAIYIATCVAAATAVSSAIWGRPKHASRRAALALAPAAAPLAAIPYLGTHSRRHPLVALAAAPFIVAGLVCSRLATDRK